jgi:peptidoglycan/LPS O-acetylase OafA/YrhL
MSKSIPYQPDIDGLRAVAVTAVLVFHFAPKLLPGGFIGVDLFFVISGYLITSIIRTELDAGTFTLRSFWERRIRRIFPALLFLVTAILLLIYLLGMPYIMARQIVHQCGYALLSFANIKFYQQVGDYWGEKAESIPLLHTWSLSVEEQFYLCLPILLVLLYRLLKGKGMLVVVGGLALLSFALCLAQDEKEKGVLLSSLQGMGTAHRLCCCPY